MNERPILFSAPMVRAILSGKKSQTRRIVKINAAGRAFRGSRNWHVDDPDAVLACSYCQVGDFLWVRETWRTETDAYNDLAPSQLSGEETVLYDADGDWASNHTTGRYRQAIHMPRWASRITLKILDVRVERLNAISEADARAEGAAFHDGRGIGHSGWRHDNQDGYVHGDARSSFARLWNGLHGPDSWTANPYVWAISFDVIRANLTEAREERAT
mgnify:CR=1 FL=1